MNKVVIGFFSGQYHASVGHRHYSCLTYAGIREWARRELGW